MTKTPTITPKENYLRLLRGETPEFVPSGYFPVKDGVREELLTPASAPNGPIVTALGVEYVGSPENNYGAMPTPGKIVVPDITNWDKYLKIPDYKDRNWEMYYKSQEESFDRNNRLLSVGGGDYFLTAVSLMGFEDTLLNMYEETDALIEMLDYISDFYVSILKKQIYYLKPDVLSVMDDDSAYHAPFFSLDMYRKVYKQFHKRHFDIALENNMPIERHDCGKCEIFIPDWVEMGVNAWNPAQHMNDLKGIKARFGNKLAINGGWNTQGDLGSPTIDMDVLKDALVEYVDTLAPNGGFVFGARVRGGADDADSVMRNDYIKEFYFDYVFDYYKTH